MNSRFFHDEDLRLPEPDVVFPLEELPPQDDFLSSSVLESTELSGQTPPHPFTMQQCSEEEAGLAGTMRQGLPEEIDPQADEAEAAKSVKSSENEQKKERIKEKIAKAKEKFPEKRKTIKKETTGLSKKQLQLVRNRISAQRSRDRKRKELQDLAGVNTGLQSTISQLESQLSSANSELALNQRVVEALPEQSRADYYRVRNELLAMQSPLASSPDEQEWAGRPSGGRFRSTLLMATAIVGCLCLVAVVCPFVMSPGTGAASIQGAHQLVPRRLMVEGEKVAEGVRNQHRGESYSLSELQ